MFECKHCVKVFTLKSNLNRHVRNFHPEEIKRKQTSHEYLRAAKIARIDQTYHQQPLLNQPYQSINPCYHQPLPNPYYHQVYHHPIYLPYPPTQQNVSTQPNATQPNVSIQPNVSMLFSTFFKNQW